MITSFTARSQVRCRPGGAREPGLWGSSRSVRCRSVVTAAPIDEDHALLRRLSAYSLRPPAPQQQQHASVEQVEQLLDGIYDGLDASIFFSKGGYVVPQRERKLIDDTGGSVTYGEVLPQGVQQLLEVMCMDADSVFCDLGSGRGRAVLQVAMTAPIKQAIGLELSDSRLDQAAMAEQSLQDKGVQLLAPVDMQRANLASCSLEQGTHFYLCSTAFSSGLCRSIAQRLAASPNFQVLVTSRQLPTQPYLYLLGDAPCQYTFTASGKCYVYVKSLLEAPLPVLAKFLCKDGVCWLPSEASHPYLAAAIEEEMVAAGSPVSSSVGGSSSSGEGGSKYITLQQDA